MYTGIVKGIYQVHDLVSKTGLVTPTFIFDEPILNGLELGASVAVDGVCLTVSKIEGNKVSFDIMKQTLETTTLGEMKVNNSFNVERSAKEGQEIGGHPLSGHIDAMIEIVNIEAPENNHVITFQAPKDMIRYIFKKGFIALNGASLTVAEINKETGQFSVFLIPETLRLTTFGAKKTGDSINLEIERKTQVMVDTIRESMKEILADSQNKD